MTIVIHNKTGNIYILKKLFGINATNGNHYGNYSIYKRPFKKDWFVRRTPEFCEKFSTLKEWRYKKKYMANKTTIGE